MFGLFGKNYKQEITLANGQPVTISSKNPFNIDQIKTHFSPTPAPHTGRKIVAWLTIIILVIGLSASGYLNWKQHRVIVSLEQSIVQANEDYSYLDNLYDQLYDRYEGEKNYYDKLEAAKNQANYDFEMIVDRIQEIQQEKDEIMNNLDDFRNESIELYNQYHYENDLYDFWQEWRNLLSNNEY